MTMPICASFHAPTLLVAEDDNQLRTLCRECLARHGFTVLESHDGLDVNGGERRGHFGGAIGSQGANAGRR